MLSGGELTSALGRRHVGQRHRKRLRARLKKEAHLKRVGAILAEAAGAGKTD